MYSLTAQAVEWLTTTDPRWEAWLADGPYPDPDLPAHYEEAVAKAREQQHDDETVPEGPFTGPPANWEHLPRAKEEGVLGG